MSPAPTCRGFILEPLKLLLFEQVVRRLLQAGLVSPRIAPRTDCFQSPCEKQSMIASNVPECIWKIDLRGPAGLGSTEPQEDGRYDT